MSTVVMIECAVCGEWVERTGPRRKYCAGCRAEKEREYKRARYEANREKELECRRAYYEANREKRLEYKRAYYEANREKELEYQRAYYEANREKELEYKRAYHEANPVAAKVRSRRHGRKMTERYPGDPNLKGQPWSPGEDAIALDDTLSTAGACELTGRSWKAVTNRRTELRRKL